MSKFFVFAACAAASVLSVFTGCQKEIVSGQTSDEKVTLRVSVQNPETKVVSGLDETAIKNYQVFVFKDNGVVEDYVSQNSPEISLDCTMGVKTVVVLANAPDVGDVTNLETLYSRTTQLSDNAPDAFVMEGRQSVTIHSQIGAYVSIAISRKVARVNLASLTLDIDMPQYSSLPFKVQSVYLINVPAETPYFNTVEPALWYNKSCYVQEDFNDLTYDDMADFEITTETPYVTENIFYCYPNNTTEDSFDATWCPRNTRLVVEATLGDEKYYYPVKLPEIKPNRIYNVNLVITRPGSETPDSNINKLAAEFNITVKDWEAGSTIMKEI